jgi:hypothetical protein
MGLSIGRAAAVLAFVGGMSAVGSVVSAAPIDVTYLIANGTGTGQGNASFENPAMNSTGDRWVYDASGPYGSKIPGWEFQIDGGNLAGQNDRDAASFPGPGGDFSQNAGSGVALAFFNLNAAGQLNQAFSNVDIVPWAPDLRYTMTVALGNVAGEGYHHAGAYRLMLLGQSGHVYASSDWIYAHPDTSLGQQGGIEDGTLKDFTFTYTTPPDFQVVPGPNNDGGAVRVQVQMLSTQAGQQNSFDDVRLTVEAVPEPTTLGLAAVGAFGLLARRCRRA